MFGMSRRNFLRGMGVMGAAGAAAALSGCAPVAAADEAKQEGTGTEVRLSDGTVWYGTPREIVEKGGSTMPPEELARRRKEYVDAQTEFVAEDGTVVPAPYVKMRALVHTYGLGGGEGPLTKSMFSRVMNQFSEEEVEAYLQMPWDRKFTANEYYYKCQMEGIDRTYEECKEICEKFSKAGFLPFRTINEGRTYNIPAIAPEGIITYSYCEEFYADPYNFEWPFNNWDLGGDHALEGTACYLSVPLNKDIMAEGSQILAYDDVRQMIEDHEYYALQPCSCRYETFAYEWYEEHGIDGEKFPTFTDFLTGEFTDFTDNNGDVIETCLTMGDDAEYLVSLGLARRVDKEEVLQVIEDRIEEGRIIHCLHGKEHAWVCFCNPKTCGIIAQWENGKEALGGWDVLEEKSIAFNHRSHYILEVDTDKCIACGTCAGRCPMGAISMDTGAPVVTSYLCRICGQCCYVCPQEARKLATRPMDGFIEPPHQMEDDNNLKASFRFEHGLIGRGDIPSIEAYIE